MQNRNDSTGRFSNICLSQRKRSGCQTIVCENQGNGSGQSGRGVCHFPSGMGGMGRGELPLQMGYSAGMVGGCFIFPRAAVTKDRKLGGLKQQAFFFSHSFRGRKSQMKESAGEFHSGGSRRDFQPPPASAGPWCC